MGTFPFELGFVTAKMSAASCLFIDGLKQVEVLNDGPRPQVELIPNNLGNLVRGDL